MQLVEHKMVRPVQNLFHKVAGFDFLMADDGARPG